jgi:hypothetical protein
MGDLFFGPDSVGPFPAKIPSFACTPHRSLSHSDKKYQAALRARLKASAQRFGIKAAPQDLGDRMVLRGTSEVLEVFSASDSLWWTDVERAYRTTSVKGAFPDDAAAIRHATKAIDKYGLDVTHAIKEASVSRATLDRVQGRKRSSHVARVDVAHRFELARLPVFGPGAKIKLSFVEGGELAQLLYFWRQPSEAGQHAVISPDDALTRFRRDPAFFRLRDTDARVEILSMTLGYFAMSPGEFQRIYIPVYALRAVARTRYLERHEFTRYVVAIDMKPEDVKQQDLVANPAACRMFS